jgi:predicted outer membrane repeat protein
MINGRGQEGGAIYLLGDSYLYINDTIFNGNKAKIGGALSAV